ncbi:MAG: response regulator transcription factor [Trueperaceae bacterium]|nr:response regulator transcription factor [Trueperaceae bacterium]MCO5173215.1 response regulator transcription factor [Trueperaceae bacterium]MCW5818664.1 response regulator transcription factor [Trueperaceae bacterium]
MGETDSAGMKVLIVEDERGISRTLEGYLKREGLATEVATTGPEALRLFRAAVPDLVLLDVMLPELDGFHVLEAIRSRSVVPVILLTARGEEDDRLLGLGLGADDYVVKPFSFRELVARVRAVLRRSYAQDVGELPLRVGRLRVDVARGTAAADAEVLPLTATEFRILAALAAAPGRLFDRGELIERALPEHDLLERSLDSHLKNLRRKLASVGAGDQLVTVRGLGFKLVAGVA